MRFFRSVLNKTMPGTKKPRTAWMKLVMSLHCPGESLGIAMKKAKKIYNKTTHAPKKGMTAAKRAKIAACKPKRKRRTTAASKRRRAYSSFDDEESSEGEW